MYMCIIIYIILYFICLCHLCNYGYSKLRHSVGLGKLMGIERALELYSLQTSRKKAACRRT